MSIDDFIKDSTTRFRIFIKLDKRSSLYPDEKTFLRILRNLWVSMALTYIPDISRFKTISNVDVKQIKLRKNKNDLQRVALKAIDRRQRKINYKLEYFLIKYAKNTKQHDMMVIHGFTNLCGDLTLRRCEDLQRRHDDREDYQAEEFYDTWLQWAT